jgi:hypothetical protein
MTSVSSLNFVSVVKYKLSHTIHCKGFVSIREYWKMGSCQQHKNLKSYNILKIEEF